MAGRPLTCVPGMAGTRLYHQHFTSKLPCLRALGGFDYPESLYFLEWRQMAERDGVAWWLVRRECVVSRRITLRGMCCWCRRRQHTALHKPEVMAVHALMIWSYSWLMWWWGRVLLFPFLLRAVSLSQFTRPFVTAKAPYNERTLLWRRYLDTYQQPHLTSDIPIPTSTSDLSEDWWIMYKINE